MKSEELYNAAFLAALPVCLSHYYRFASDTGNHRNNHSLIQAAVEEAHAVAVAAREEWLKKKEKTRRQGGLPT